MDNDCAFEGRLGDWTAYPFAAIVVLALAGIIVLGLATREGVEGAPAASLASRATPSSMATAKPRIALAPTLRPSLFRGLIGLPPETAEPSAPEVGELVESYWVAGGGLPYRGMARLYADGRLIWNRYYSGPVGPNSLTTGYLEQRLTPEGVELVKRETYLPMKDPLQLLERFPLHFFEVRWPVPYVPSGYGICFYAQDPRPGRAAYAVTTEPAELIEMLPASVSSLLAGREYVSPIDWDQDCIVQTTDEARALERVLREASYDQNAFTNGFMVQYSVPVPGAYGLEISLMFEPRFPDGSVGCSACG
jgi:hypothetical protein